MATNSCQMILEDEIDQAENNGTIRGDDGLMPLSVSYDMQWLKRGRANDSHKHKHRDVENNNKDIYSTRTQ